MKIKKGLTTFILIFIVIGLLSMVGGILMMVHYANFQKTAETIKAEIVEIDTYREKDSDGDYVTRHDVYVTYTFDDVTYEHVSFGHYKSSMREGITIDILCDPENPRKIKQKEAFDSSGAMLIAFGLIFFLIGAVPASKSLANNVKKKSLLSKGNTIYALIQSIDLNTSFSFNDVHPYRIVCSYGSYTFQSENLWSDIPSMYQVGDTIEVVVNPEDYSKYFVNVREK